MQYIQLQGQVAEELDIPINGSFNLFIDTSDNSIKAKDGDGNLTGGGNSLTEITKTELDQHISSGELTPGTFYKITGVSSGSDARDIQEGGTTIILQAATTSSLNPRGVGLFWNPKYYNPNTDLGEYQVWDDIFEFTLSGSLEGQFFDMEETIYLDAPSNIVLRPNILDNRAIATLTDPTAVSYFMDSENYPIPFESANTVITGSLTNMFTGVSYTDGDKVIYGGRVWQNLSGSIGSTIDQFNLNSEDWSVVEYNSTDYDLVADVIEYDYTNDMICYRKDVTHNIEVLTNYKWENDDDDENGIRRFPWGHPQIYNVTLENTSTDNLVNFGNTNRISGLHMKHGSRFEANYWGKENDFTDIFGDCDSDIQNLSLGKYANFNNIRLGINSTIGGGDTLYIVGNDGDTVTDITMGMNCDIYGMNMYQYSRIDGITMQLGSDIYDINMYDESYLRDITMSSRSSLNNISMGYSSDIYETSLDTDAYIANINLDRSSEIYGVELGRSSYMDYNSLSEYCNMYDIKLGVESSINCVQLYNESDNSSTINSISLGDGSGFGSVNLHSGTYISNIDGLTQSGFGEISLTGSSAHISNFQLGQNANFGGLTIDSTVNGDAYLEYFKIGQDTGFGGDNIETIITNVTVERGFNTYRAGNFIAGFTSSIETGVSWSDVNTFTQLDPLTSFQILDTTDWDASTSTLNYYLEDGDYNGQTIKFFLTNNGISVGDNIGNLCIWMSSFTSAFDLADTYSQTCWFPFTDDNGSRRNDIPQCIWMNGKWVIDNNRWAD